VTISGQAVLDVLIFLLAGPLNEILVFVWYPVIMITIISEYYDVISDYQHLHAMHDNYTLAWQPLINPTWCDGVTRGLRLSSLVINLIKVFLSFLPAVMDP